MSELACPASKNRPSFLVAAIALAVLSVQTTACDGCVVPAAADDAGPLEPGVGPGTPGPGVGPETPGPGVGPEAEPNPARHLDIEPLSPRLDATVGGAEQLQLVAFVVDDDAGTREQVSAGQVFWQSLDPVIGTIDDGGAFRSSEERAGIARVRARAFGLEGTTEVAVTLVDDRPAPDGTGPDDFNGTLDPNAPGPNVIYPADGVIIPANLAPMLFQWDRTRPNARVVLEGARGSLVLYTAADRVQSGGDAWRRFLLGHIGSTFTVKVQESDGPGTAVTETRLDVTLADADLTSTVYYWAVNVGRIVRIDADSLEPIQLDIPFDNGPQGGAPNDDNNQCRACHMLSANGQRMAFTYFGGNGPGGLVDVGDVGTPTIQNQDGRRWNFAAPNPDGSLLVSNLNRRLSVRSGLTGDVVPGFEDLTGIDSAHPAYSPVGDRIAFAGDIANADGSVPNWEIDFDRSNLYVLDFDVDGPTVGTARMVVPADGAANFYPSFAPGGELLAYTRGPHSRSRWQEANLPGALWVADATTLTPDPPRLELVRANPEGNSYNPTFNPVVEGGYLWIAFFSRRDYGHITRGTERPQIWVAAIDQNASPATGVDPSHPAFWLPGQRSDTDNLTSFFAPRPCEDAGGACDLDAACCGDLLCRPDENGEGQCVPPEEACGLTGDLCIDDTTCCQGLLCGITGEGGQRECLPPGEVCSENQQVCNLDADCCEGAGLCVDDGTGQTRCLTDEQRPPGDCALLGESCAVLECCSPTTLCVGDMCVPLGG